MITPKYEPFAAFFCGCIRWYKISSIQTSTVADTDPGLTSSMRCACVPGVYGLEFKAESSRFQGVGFSVRAASRAFKGRPQTISHKEL